MKKTTKRLWVLFVSGFIVFQSCQINEPQLPTWDVSLNIPVVKKNYTMADLLEKSNELNFYTDGVNKNILYYSKTSQLDNIKIDDKLKIDGITKNASETIGSISLEADSVTADIGYSWLSSSINPNTQAVIPPINNIPVSVNTDAANEFVTAKIETGTVDLTITNHFPSPVSISLSNIKLKNTSGGEVLFNYSGSINVPAKSSVTVKAIALTPNVVAKNQFTLDCSVSTSGSGGNLITVPQNSFSVKAKFNNLSVSETQAKIPTQDPVTIDNTIVFDEGAAQPTKYSTVKIESGSMNISVVNSLDLDAQLTVTIDNLKNSLGQTYSTTKSILRKQTTSISISSLKDYSLVSSNGSPTNLASYKISITVAATSDYRTIKSTDGISGTIVISELKIKEFSGQLQPKTITEEKSSVSLDVKDLKDKFDFQQINLYNPIAQIRLRSNSQFEFKIDGRIEGKNNLGQKAILGLNSKTLSSSIITPTDSILTINSDSLSAFFKKFSRFPDSLIVYAGGILNPNYKTIYVKNTDVVYGRSNLELPMYLGLSNAILKDSVEVDLSNDDRDKLKDVNSMEAGIKLSNGLPASFTFTGKLYDDANKFLTYFPPKYSDQDTVLNFSGASTDISGNVISKNEQTVKVKAVKADIDKILKAKYMRVILKLNTTSSGNSPVKFKTTDEVLINAFGSANYQVK